MLRTRVRTGPIAGLGLSLVFAALLTLVQAGDRYVLAWTPHFGKPAPVTLRIPYGPRLVRDRATGRAQFYYEDKRALVPRGTRLLPHVPAHQTAYLFEMAHRPPQWPRLVGIFVICFTLLMAMMAYMRNLGQNRLRLLRTQIGLFAAMGMLAMGAKLLLLFSALPAYWIPTAVVPLFVATVFDRRTALLVVVVLSFVVASLLNFDLIVLSILLARGTAATLFYWDRKYPQQMVTSGLVAGLSAAALYVAIVVNFEGRFDMLADLLRPGDSQLLAVGGGGFAAGLLGTLLRAPAERLLGNVPRERLLQLQDLSQPLLQQLAREAPGTYEHSRSMANLAEQAASAIGADALLTRVGAYYHDVGKAAQPKYFVENLEPGEPSPHDDLEPDVSADAIMAHVVVGARILREGGIPEPVVEFAYTHHGNQVVDFFWNRCVEQGNPKQLQQSDFRYPGMRPQTKETAILMLVDSIEAASRTIDPADREQFGLMVQRIAFAKLRSGELDDCGLSLSELRVVANRVTDTLVNMHHHRIRYPWQVQQAEEFGVPSRAMVRSGPDLELGPHETAPPPAVDRPSAPEPGVVEPASPAAEARVVPPVADSPGPSRRDSAPSLEVSPAPEPIQAPAVSASEPASGETDAVPPPAEEDSGVRILDEPGNPER